MGGGGGYSTTTTYFLETPIWRRVEAGAGSSSWPTDLSRDIVTLNVKENFENLTLDEDVFFAVSDLTKGGRQTSEQLLANRSFL
jgi:hypothetical protein